jgi:two-component system KDP operon response regulator KdpE
VTRALVVDDEPQILRALKINLSARGYDVRVAADGRTALRVAAEHHPEVVILDLGLPDMPGTDVIAGLRGWTSVPILVLSGRAESADKVDALDAGADDYVTKPFSMDELLARLRAMVRRQGSGEEDASRLEIGDAVVDLAARTVTRPLDGSTSERVEVRLTPTEWAVLEVLVRHPGKLVSQRQLLADVWGPGYRDETNYLRTYLARLRRKLELDPTRPRHLITESGMGYRFAP